MYAMSTQVMMGSRRPLVVSEGTNTRTSSPAINITHQPHSFTFLIEYFLYYFERLYYILYSIMMLCFMENILRIEHLSVDVMIKPKPLWGDIYNTARPRAYIHS